jgi:putative acetyltransferase
MEVERRSRATQNDLAAALRLDKSTMSRIVAELAHRGWVQVRPDREDGRLRVVVLTARGKERLSRIHSEANAQVQRALAVLNEADRDAVLHGMSLYARALSRSRLQAGYVLRPIQRKDNPQIARLIRTVMTELGAAGPGFAIHDAEVDDMYRAYRRARSAYFVLLEPGGRVAGGGGLGPLEGGDAETCELRKMYSSPETRGRGLGQLLVERCMEAARSFQYRRMYLESMRTMQQARALYEKNGFRSITKPLGHTGHFACDSWFARDL